MASPRMGFEGILLRGTAGSTAATAVTNSRDITESFDADTGDTTVRGADGSGPPIETVRITRRKYDLQWNMTEDDTDTSLTAFKAAAAAGTPIAIRTKSYTSGTGIDMDMVITSIKQGKPINGESTVDITAKPNRDNRTPQFNV